MSFSSHGQHKNFKPQRGSTSLVLESNWLPSRGINIFINTKHTKYPPPPRNYSEKTEPQTSKAKSDEIRKKEENF